MGIEEQKSQPSHLMPDEIKWAIVVFKKDAERENRDISNKEIARRILEIFGRRLGNSTVKGIWDKYQQKGNVGNDWSHEGRPRSLTNEHLEQIRVMIEGDRLASAREIRDELELPASRETVNREMLRLGYHAYRAPIKSLLSFDNMNQRLQFAQEHLYWDLDDWHSIIFTDESSFKLISTNGRIYVRRRQDEAFQEDTVQHSDHWSSSMLVWGAISPAGVGPLVRMEGTVDSDEYLNAFRHRLWRWYPGLYNQTQIFQDDNARPHTSQISNDWFENYGILRMQWPSKSPDCNIIEDVWNHLKYQLRGRIYQGEDELWEDLKEKWNQVPQDLIDRLYRSLPNRMRAVIRARGGITKY